MKGTIASILAGCVLTWLALVVPVHGATTGEVFLSNDAPYEEATYILQFVTGARGNVAKIQVALPPGTNAANAWLGRFLVGRDDDEDKGDEVVAARLVVVPPDTLIVELQGHPHVKKGTTIMLELFHLTNPTAGSNHQIQVTTLDRRGHAVEALAPIVYGTYSPNPLDAIQTGTGLVKNGSTLSIDTSAIQARVAGSCPAGSSIRVIGADGTVTCQTDVTSLNTAAGSGLQGSGTTGDVTLNVDPTVIQKRVAGTCPAGSYIRAIGADGTVTCQTDNVGITSVTTPATSGLQSTTLNGGVTLNFDPTVIQRRVPIGCPEGSSIRVIAESGAVTCQTDNVGAGTITGVTTAPNSGLLGGASSGVANLAVNTNLIQSRITGSCPAGIAAVDALGNVTCQTAVVPGVSGVSGVTGTSGVTAVTGPNGAVTLSIAPGAITTTQILDGTVGAVDVNSAEVQLRVNGTCAAGAISQINQDGTVLCSSPSGGVTAVTASAPLFSTGGTLPNISIRGVIVSGTNAAIGTSALGANRGVNNTASGVQALARNTTGTSNTAAGANALFSNTVGSNNTADGSSALAFNTGSNNTGSGFSALFNNSIGSGNTAAGANSLNNNTTGSLNTAVGAGADVLSGGLTNATVIGSGALVDASNKVRIGNDLVTVIEFPAGASVTGGTFTSLSDRNRKENFRPVNGEEVLQRIRDLVVTSWNYIGQDPTKFRHYGPMAQDFYAAFGHDGMGTVGTPTTITSTDIDGILMIAIRALEQRTAELKAREARVKALELRLEALERVIGTTPAGLE